MAFNTNTAGNRQLYYFNLDTQWTNQLLNFTGSHIYCLNEYIPNPIVSYLADKQIDINAYTLSVVNNAQSQHLIHPLLANSTYNFPFERLYLTAGGLYDETVNTLNLVRNGGSLLAILLSQNPIANLPIIRQNYWEHRYRATLPAVAGQADFIIAHDAGAVMSVSFSAVSVVNPLRLRLIQLAGLSGATFTDLDIWPAAFPYFATWELPYRFSEQLQVIIDGGGAAEAGFIGIEIQERRR